MIHTKSYLRFMIISEIFLSALLLPISSKAAEHYRIAEYNGGMDSEELISPDYLQLKNELVPIDTSETVAQQGTPSQQGQTGTGGGGRGSGGGEHVAQAQSSVHSPSSIPVASQAFPKGVSRSMPSLKLDASLVGQGRAGTSSEKENPDISKSMQIADILALSKSENALKLDDLRLQATLIGQAISTGMAAAISSQTSSLVIVLLVVFTGQTIVLLVVTRRRQNTKNGGISKRSESSRT